MDNLLKKWKQDCTHVSHSQLDTLYHLKSYTPILCRCFGGYSVQSPCASNNDACAFNRTVMQPMYCHVSLPSSCPVCSPLSPLSYSPLPRCPVPLSSLALFLSLTSPVLSPLALSSSLSLSLPPSSSCNSSLLHCYEQ